MRKTIILAALLALVSGPVLARGGDVDVESGSFSGAGVDFEQEVSPSYHQYDAEIPTNTKATIKNVPDVIPPGISAAPETCGIPVSGGVSWVGFGIGGGTAYTDERCADRLDARQLGQFGVQVNEPKLVWGGVELMCKGEAQEALARAGVTCGEQPEAAPADEASVRPVSNDAFAFQSVYGE